MDVQQPKKAQDEESKDDTLSQVKKQMSELSVKVKTKISESLKQKEIQAYSQYALLKGISKFGHLPYSEKIQKINLVNKNGDVSMQLDLNVKKFKDFAGDAADIKPAQKEQQIDAANQPEEKSKIAQKNEQKPVPLKSEEKKFGWRLKGLMESTSSALSEKWKEVKVETKEQSAKLYAWSDTNYNEIKQKLAELKQPSEENSKLLASVTYHQLDIFRQLCPDSILSSFYSSLNPKFMKDEGFTDGDGGGRSGSFFFFSHDKKLILKTISEDELQFYLQNLNAFTHHLLNKKSSLLARIFGVFTIKASYQDESETFYAMVMENTVQAVGKIKYSFDLKGSLVDRKTKQDASTLKDQNFIEISNEMKPQKFIRFTDSDRETLIYAVRNDVAFLKSLKIMDYSLLLCIENSQNTGQSVHIFCNDQETYHVAVIDYLQLWNTSKKAERLMKTKVLQKDGKKLSAVEPQEYADRFIQFMLQNVLI